MSILTLLSGALTLRTDTFKNLRERSDVFQRGFTLLLLVALLAGIFDVGVSAISSAARPESEAQVTDQAIRNFEQSYTGPAELQPMIESYIREGVAMVYEISSLPPNAGAAFRPVARFLDWLGQVLTKPFGFAVLGYFFLAALLVHLTSRWLGGRAGMSQMLGLGALSYSVQVLYPILSLLTLGQNLTQAAALGTISGLLGFLLFIWSLVIYVKAVAIAQEFSYGRAIGAILLAVGLVILVVVLAGCIVGGLAASLLASLFPGIR